MVDQLLIRTGVFLVIPLVIFLQLIGACVGELETCCLDTQQSCHTVIFNPGCAVQTAFTQSLHRIID